MTDEKSITITHDGDRIDLTERHAAALLLAADTDAEITTTDARDAAPVDLPHSTQGQRILRDLEDAGLMETWKPDERADGRNIPPALRGHLTRRGREVVEAHRMKLQTMEPLSREAEVVRQMLADHRSAMHDDLDEFRDRLDALDERVDEADWAAADELAALEDRVSELEARVDGVGNAQTKLHNRVSSLESKVSRHSDFIEEQSRRLKKLKRRL